MGKPKPDGASADATDVLVAVEDRWDDDRWEDRWEDRWAGWPVGGLSSNPSVGSGIGVLECSKVPGLPAVTAPVAGGTANAAAAADVAAAAALVGDSGSAGGFRAAEGVYGWDAGLEVVLAWEWRATGVISPSSLPRPPPPLRGTLSLPLPPPSCPLNRPPSLPPPLPPRPPSPPPPPSSSPCTEECDSLSKSPG